MTDLTGAALRDALQGAVNATTTLWYGTSDMVAPGKALMCEGAPPFVVIHPDDVGRLPEGARHLREHAPTRADVAEHARQWLIDHPIPIEPYQEEPIGWVCRRRFFV